MRQEIKDALVGMGSALVDQEAAQVLVTPQGTSEGFWFGGGNVIQDADGTYWLCGRYRNHGDSRTGVDAGERGLELAIFKAQSPLGPWQKALSFSKADLAHGGEDVVSIETFELLTRGPVWDVACTRVTDRLAVPSLGKLAEVADLSLYFYDGAECLRQLDENPKAHSRPRGYSCEEIGGLAFGFDDAFPAIQRLSVDEPLFVSPHGTGCSRYVSTLVTGEGILATWQQSQPDLSQPLVGNFLPMARVEELLG